MLTSWSEQSTPAELSIASVLIRRTPSANSTRPREVKPRLPPSPTTRQRSWPRRCALVVALVLHVGVRLRRGLDVRADAVPQQVDGRAQDRRGSLVRGQGLVSDVQPGPDLRESRTVFAVREDPAPGEISDAS